MDRETMIVQNVTKRKSDTSATFMITYISWAREMSVADRMYSQCRCELSKAIKITFMKIDQRVQKFIPIYIQKDATLHSLF